MIKAIVFDCFGVLVTEAWETFCEEYFGSSTPQRQAAHDLAKRLNLGHIGYEAFLREVAELANISQDLARKYIDGNKPNLPLLRYIQEQLKPHFKIGMLSNAGNNWIEKLFSRQQIELFDSIVLSYEHQLVKPQPEIYEVSLHELGVKAEEGVFVDDIERYCQAAEDIGMKAIHYQSFQGLTSELERLLNS